MTEPLFRAIEEPSVGLYASKGLKEIYGCTKTGTARDCLAVIGVISYEKAEADLLTHAEWRGIVCYHVDQQR